MKHLIIALFSVIYPSIFASNVEIVWRKIDTQYFYKDSKKECTTQTSTSSHVPGEAHLALELVDGKVLSARFWDSMYKFPRDRKFIDFEPSELNSIELVRDKKGQAWVKKILLSERLAKWLIYFPTQDSYLCKIASLPRTITPQTMLLSFETEGIEIGVEISYGNWLTLKGRLPDGDDFEEMIRLVQRKVIY